mmetsp:Transcript_47574/g.83173  ORF Transcript_47574/g.83173 Transcript_47574/m.83173 type:complete len:664 (-) Transcript_47574:82-2073(-)
MWSKLFLAPVLAAILFKAAIDYELFGAKFSIILPMVLKKLIWFRITQPIYKHTDEIKWNPGSYRTKEKGGGAMPNIVLILVDDLGFNDLSGGCGVATPNIDSIRTNGAVFTQAYSGQATCAPSRAALLTGRFSTRFGSEFTPGPKAMARILSIPKPNDLIQPVLHPENLKLLPPMREMVVPLNETMIGNVLQEGGYDTYHIGKWDCGPGKGYTALARGFNETLSFDLGGAPYLEPGDPDLVNGYGNEFDDFVRWVLRFHIDHNDGPFFKPDKYMTDYLSEHAANLIKTRTVKRGEKQQMDPFFLDLSYNAPHNPYQALRSDYEDPEVQKLPNLMARVYAAMIKSLDRGIGQVLQALKDANVYDNTIVIFTSDNGGAHYAGFPKMNHPFRGWKGTLFEGGIHVPMFMQWPAVIKPPVNCVWEYGTGSGMRICQPLTIDTPVGHVDFFTSFASLTRTTEEARQKPLANGVHLDGINIFDLVHSAIRTRSEWEARDYRMGGDWPEVPSTPETIQQAQTELKGQTRTLFWRSGHYMAVRVGDWKLQVALRPNKVWFFHLLSDPYEERNLALEVNVTTQESMAALFATLTPTDPDMQILLEGIEPSAVTVGSHEYLSRQLKRINDKLVETNSQQVPPRWPAASETPVTIDKVFKDKQEPGDEYVLWPN